MPILKNDFSNGIKMQPIGADSDVVSMRLEYDLAAALVLNDVLDLGFLPAGHVPVDVMMLSDDVDTGATPLIILSCGILNAAKTAISSAAADGGAAWIVSSTVGQAGGLVRPTTVAIGRVATSESPRSVGIHITAAPATGTATGKIGLILSYRPSCYGI